MLVSEELYEVQETITRHVPRLEPESIQIPSEPPVDPQNVS